MTGYQVKNVDADVNNYKTYFCFDKIDIEVLTEYINQNSYNIIVRRLDNDSGWGDNIEVLVYYRDQEKNTTINIGSSEKREKIVVVETDFIIEPSTEIVNRSTEYNLRNLPSIYRISREEFNRDFSTDIVVLPKSMYAVGLQNGSIYMYNQDYHTYFMIEECIKHILQVALTFTNYDRFYFIISAYDGYMEGHYNHVRTVEKQIGDNEYENRMTIELPNLDEYAILHKNKWVISQANHKGMPYVLDIVDRHYFYHNLYNPFRSYHKGIPFSQKQNKIVFGGQDRGSKYNFANRRDIEINQRDYFKSDAVSKVNIVCSGWIDRSEMIHYKYILDIDGNSSTWDATAWKLNSGSVILKTESCWRQWFYDEYLPNVHYIEIKDDFSDLQEKYQWCESHQEECQIMIHNCKALFQKVYKYQNIMEYTKILLDKINLSI
jgi:hypothetical protein